MVSVSKGEYMLLREYIIGRNAFSAGSLRRVSKGRDSRMNRS